MRYTVLNSSVAVKNEGLPYSVALIQPREVLAAFRDEGAAVNLCKQLNGNVMEEAIQSGGESMADRMVESPEEEPRVINVGVEQKPLYQQKLDALKAKQ